jgi:hypothetical protein
MMASKANQLPHPYSTLQAAQLPGDSYYLVRSVHHQLGGGGPTPVSPFPRVDLSRKPEPQRSERERLYVFYDVLDGVLKDFEDDPPPLAIR